jgi:hypothetical protein
MTRKPNKFFGHPCRKSNVLRVALQEQSPDTHNVGNYFSLTRAVPQGRIATMSRRKRKAKPPITHSHWPTRQMVYNSQRPGNQHNLAAKYGVWFLISASKPHGHLFKSFDTKAGFNAFAASTTAPITGAKLNHPFQPT